MYPLAPLSKLHVLPIIVSWISLVTNTKWAAQIIKFLRMYDPELPTQFTLPRTKYFLDNSDSDTSNACSSFKEIMIHNQTTHVK
jgi:hypothetical protein